jgi:hypothetical protein
VTSDANNALATFNARFRAAAEEKDAKEREGKAARKAAGKQALKKLLAERKTIVDARKAKNREDEQATEQRMLDALQVRPVWGVGRLGWGGEATAHPLRLRLARRARPSHLLPSLSPLVPPIHPSPSQGESWSRVVSLVDVHGSAHHAPAEKKSSKQQQQQHHAGDDTTRMKDILIGLKAKPLAQ